MEKRCPRPTKMVLGAGIKLVFSQQIGKIQKFPWSYWRSLIDIPIVLVTPNFDSDCRRLNINTTFFDHCFQRMVPLYHVDGNDGCCKTKQQGFNLVPEGLRCSGLGRNKWISMSASVCTVGRFVGRWQADIFIAVRLTAAAATTTVHRLHSRDSTMDFVYIFETWCTH